ncbi:hypothetical protein RRG08_005801 [Elysia crispata]|uniref:Uncharacterized protein n=1 Tax=Elysia crispata TaxID=231223 RepID=A0AAE0ZVC2_9GAST|nr:hypothetical protein RRG08_005801 [Elysia crispata]
MVLLLENRHNDRASKKQMVLLARADRISSRKVRMVLVIGADATNDGHVSKSRKLEKRNLENGDATAGKQEIWMVLLGETKCCCCSETETSFTRAGN